MNWLAQIDQQLFFFLNVTCANPVTDLLMPLFTSDTLLRVIFVVVVICLLVWGNNRARWVCLFVVVTVALTDQTAAHLLKPLIARPRPCHNLTNINLLVNCGAGMSMPSAHAANVFGQTILFSILYQRVRWPVIIFAAIVSLSRVFVGVHYPGDITVGAFIGIGIGLAVALLFQKIESKLPGIEKVTMPPRNG